MLLGRCENEHPKDALAALYGPDSDGDWATITTRVHLADATWMDLMSVAHRHVPEVHTMSLPQLQVRQQELSCSCTKMMVNSVSNLSDVAVQLIVHKKLCTYLKTCHLISMKRPEAEQHTTQ